MSKKTFKVIIYIFLFVFLVYNFGIKTYFNYQANNQSTQLYQSFSNDNLPWQKLGHSNLGNAINFIELGNTNDVTLIIGGIHGDEYGSFNLAYKLSRLLSNEPDLINKKVVIVPLLNPDGLLAAKRTNSNNVDIDRNFPSRNWSPVYQDDDTYPGSEPSSEQETLLIMEVLNKYKPNKVIILHSKLERITFEGPAQGMAGKLSHDTGYEIIHNLQTNGSIEQYLGRDLNISCVNINLPDYDPEQRWLENKEALINAINY